MMTCVHARIPSKLGEMECACARQANDESVESSTEGRGGDILIVDHSDPDKRE